MKKSKIIFTFLVAAYLFMFLGVWAAMIIRRENSEYYKERLKYFKKDTTGHVKVLFLGNSITEGFDIDGFYRNKDYLNRGISGDMTLGILQRINEIVSRNPDTIILMIGVNDISRGIVLGTVLKNYDKILNIFKEKIPDTKIFILSLLPVRNNFKFRRLVVNTIYFISFVRPFNINDKIKLFNKKLSSLVKKHKYRFIDLHDSFLDQSGYLRGDFASDYVHLNNNGYKYLYRFLNEELFKNPANRTLLDAKQN